MSIIEPTQSPTDEVSWYKTEIADLLIRIEKKTLAYGKGEETNWVHVGWMFYVKEELEKIAKFLKA